jgi:hypothetical protein
MTQAGVRTVVARTYKDTDGWWSIEVPELTSPAPDGGVIIATGMATNFRGIEKAAHEVAAVWTGDDSIAVDVKVEVPDDLKQLWNEGTVAEAEAAVAKVHAAAVRREAVNRLREQGYPLEAVAAGLGISYQRAQQLSARKGR